MAETFVLIHDAAYRRNESSAECGLMSISHLISWNRRVSERLQRVSRRPSRREDAEQLPYPNGHFDVVASMFGAIFAPRPEQVASILTSIISAREDFLFTNRSGRSDI